MKEWAITAVVLLLLAFGAMMSCIALSYPESIRYGYKSCGNCHVSPTGGGAVTGYGRMAGEEMAMHAPEGSGQLFGLLELPERVAIGGDTRYLSVRSGDYRRTFLMQMDCELAVRPSAEVWVDGLWGRYGADGRTESRRNFVLWVPSPMVSLRAGRFFPAYGILLPDHTAATRQGLGFGEGQESYNAEAVVRTEWGELFLTGAVGDGTSAEVGRDPDYQLHPQGLAYLGRLAVFLGKTAQVGASYRLELPDQAGQPIRSAGPFVLWGITKELYLLAEADRRAVAGTHQDVAYSELGYEVYRGIHVQVTDEYVAGGRPGVGLQWFPLAHLEALARAKFANNVWVSEFLLHLNW